MPNYWSVADSGKIRTILPGFIMNPGLVRFAFLDGESAAVVMEIISEPNYALRPPWCWYGIQVLCDWQDYL